MTDENLLPDQEKISPYPSRARLYTAIVLLIAFLTWFGIVGMQPVDRVGCATAVMTGYHFNSASPKARDSGCDVTFPLRGALRVGDCREEMHLYRGDVAVDISKGRFTGGYFYRIENTGRCLADFIDF